MRADLEASAGPMHTGRAVSIGTNGAVAREMAWADTFGMVPVGEPMLYVDSYDRLTLAVNQGNAAQALGLVQDQPIRITAT
jgi:S-adenosylmethionine hydrolase